MKLYNNRYKLSHLAQIMPAQPPTTSTRPRASLSAVRVNSSRVTDRVRPLVERVMIDLYAYSHADLSSKGKKKAKNVTIRMATWCTCAIDLFCTCLAPSPCCIASSVMYGIYTTHMVPWRSSRTATRQPRRPRPARRQTAQHHPYHALSQHAAVRERSVGISSDDGMAVGVYDAV